MIKTFLLSFAIFIVTGLSAQHFLGAEAQKILPSAQEVYVKSNTSKIEYIKLKSENQLLSYQIEAYLREQFNWNSNYGIKWLRSFQDELGQIHQRYQLTYNKIPIHDGVFITHAAADGRIFSINGNFYGKNIPSNSYRISEAKALQKALDFIGAKKYKWELPEEEQFIKKLQKDSKASWFPKASKEIVRSSQLESYKYAYVFNIYAQEPMSRAEYFVDAQSGKILSVNNLIHHADTAGTAITKYSGTKDIISDLYNGTFRLRESGRGNGVETYDLNNATTYSGAVDFIDSNNIWNNVNTQQDEIAGDAHWGMEMTYDYYLHEHNRNSIDGNGFKLIGYVHYDNNYVNAFWNGQFMTFGDGNSTYSPLVTLDIVGHEITHGLTSNTADLDYSYESGAMNEAYSDIFGTAIEAYGKPNNHNWLIGEGIGNAFRSMSNPKSKGDPDTYLGTNYYLGSADNGGVHTNSGVLNHWFYLTSDGGQGVNDNNDTFNLVGVGIDTAAQVAFRTLTVYLTNTSQYADARFYSILSAMDLYGPCSAPVKATTSAFYAVGIGPDYVDGVQADFETMIQKYCVAPSDVSFTNLSNNANQFYWDFGDGDTSSATNPLHTYNSYGNFVVKLIASGGSCGVDSIIKTEYISVDSINPCFTYVPVGGATVDQNCEGVLFDDGGWNNYSNNVNSTVTIAPLGAASVNLTFKDFHFESGYDYVKIYDGPNIQSPLIGSYDGDALPNGGLISSTSSSLTILQVSDQQDNKAGFVATWSCVQPTLPPVADFKVMDTISCSGIVQFQDLTSNGVLKWHWDFGDGDTSTVQHPVHYYAQNGFYTVTLVASNVVGSHTVTKQAVVHVDMPSKPYVASASVCNGGSVQLNVTNAQGNILWYDAATATTPINSGASYTTPNLTQSTSYWVEEEKSNPLVSGGKPNNGGGGGNLNYQQSLIFDVYSPAVLHSVNVYANGSGSRTINLMDANDNVLQTKTVNVSNGLNTLVLDFPLTVGNGFKLSSKNLYRNNNNVSYPYVISGILSINRSSAGSNPLKYYYYFYDWKVKKPSCKSDRREVHAYVNSAAPVADFSITNNDPYISLVNTSQNPGTSSWSFGDGGASILDNPNHLYLQNGTYSIQMNVNNGCGSDTKTKSITIGLATSLQNAEENADWKLYPNPSQSELNLVWSREMEVQKLMVYDFSGKLIYQSHLAPQEKSLQLRGLSWSAGIYLIQLQSKDKIWQKKFIITE